MTRDIVAQIQAFNQGRNPELLKLKYQSMATNAFVFLRGTCHLFYQDLPADAAINNAPPVWSCGDLHLQNFGSYKGDDRLVYFDLNDFDESALAPCTWDVTRFLTSVLVGAHTLDISDEEAQGLCNYFLESYTAALATGKDRTIHRETAKGLVADLLNRLKLRDRKSFLADRTDLKGKQRKLKLIPEKTTPVTSEERSQVTDLIHTWATTQKNPQFFNVLDVAHRIAGTGSLGLDRYIILVEGNGSPHANYLLDLKAARSSSLHPHLQIPQPNWSNEAGRITSIQHRFQESPPALLNPLPLDGKSYVLRELQPTADRVDLTAWNGKIKRLQRVMQTMAEVTAWGQLRSGGRQGSAIADDLIAFAQDAPNWHSVVLDYVRSYAAQVEADYIVFRDAFDQKQI
ncbi:DUF2252 domain-containing protein [Phormidesmis sp. 146-12]